MANRLANATSPYLRQHADNPVDWQVWGEEALAQANREDKPILLSIGYSACHWCHVMAHESFEDPAIAKVMNEHFVNIKVDREERPDLDQIYQTAHALMTRRSGGWPLTMFLTPDGAPFFAGTYFPKESRYGVPGFVDVLPKVAAAYRQQGSAITEHGNRLAEALSSLDPEPASTLPDGVSKRALAGLVRQFDRTDGGFGSAPKFPHAAELDLCLRAYALHGDEDAGTIVRTTLSKMADGGIHDQLGGGFCRYSVDAQWSIPHFEKMLYDNAALLSLYADAARTTNERRFADVARDIVGWVDREMRASDGAFYSSLDADSEGEEGKFYVWTRDEARASVSDEEWQAAAAHYGFEGPPNFEGHAWNPRIVATVDVIADRLQTSLPDVQTRLIGARAGLFRARETRVRPARDDKILTSWNALMIAALARASRALDEPRWADIAFDALDALVNTAWGDDRLHATRHGDVVALNGYLDDHAFLLAALIEAMQTRFRAKDWTLAITLADQLLDRFEDRERGGFFFTSHDHERLFHRMKPAHDNATPSGNGVAAQSLITLSHMTSEQRYLDAAERAVKAFAEGLAEAPGAQSSLAIALERLQSPPSLLVLMGEASKVSEFQRTLERRYRPDLVVLPLPGDDVPDALRKGERPPTGVAAWLCHGTQCLPPVSDVEAVEGLLRANA